MYHCTLTFASRRGALSGDDDLAQLERCGSEHEVVRDVRATEGARRGLRPVADESRDERGCLSLRACGRDDERIAAVLTRDGSDPRPFDYYARRLERRSGVARHMTGNRAFLRARRGSGEYYKSERCTGLTKCALHDSSFRRSRKSLGSHVRDDVSM